VRMLRRHCHSDGDHNGLQCLGPHSAVLRAKACCCRARVQRGDVRVAAPTRSLRASSGAWCLRRGVWGAANVGSAQLRVDPTAAPAHAEQRAGTCRDIASMRVACWRHLC